MAVVAAVQVRVDAKNASQQLQTLNQKSKTLNGGFKSASTGAAGLGAAIKGALGPIATITTAIAGVTKAFQVFGERQADAEALRNGLKNLGITGSEVLDALQAKADEFGKVTLFSQEDFTKASTQLTSFTNIAVKDFDRVIGVAADVAQVMGQDVKSATTQLAKALNAPTQNLSALSRSGIQFTEQQKEQIKALEESGKLQEAQGLILEELERQYKGAAKAAGSAGMAGAVDGLVEAANDAFEILGKMLEPIAVPIIRGLSKAVEYLADTWNYISNVIFPAVRKAAKPLTDALARIFTPERIKLFGDLLRNIAIKNLEGMVVVVEAVSKVLGFVFDRLADLAESPVFQFLVDRFEDILRILGLNNNKVDKFNEKTKTSVKEADKILGKQVQVSGAIDKTTEAQQRMVESLKLGVAQLEEQKRVIGDQEAAFSNAMNVTSARLDAEREINNLQGAQLEAAYEMAGSAKGRLEIAKAIFQNDVEAAKIAYERRISEIDAAKQTLEFKRAGAIIDAEILKARGEMAILEAKGLEQKKAAQQKAQEVLNTQMRAVGLIDKQIQAQAKVAQYQKQAAEAQLKGNILTAEQKLKQKLVSDEIGLSQTEANNLARELGQGAIKSTNLNTGMTNVKNSTQQTSFMMIRVATEADRAAASINRAAAAQRNLNAARAQGGGGSPQGAAQGAYWPGGFQAFAKGGMVTGPTLGLIGEGGEPEYIIPQSKAAGFAANYLSGQRGAGAIPAFADGGYVAPSSANVNIQTGPVTQMDGTNYVTTKDLGRAVQAGVNQTLDLIRRDGNTRAALGLS